MKQGVNNSRVYNRHRYRTFLNRENIQNYYNAYTRGEGWWRGWLNMYGGSV